MRIRFLKCISLGLVSYLFVFLYGEGLVVGALCPGAYFTTATDAEVFDRERGRSESGEACRGGRMRRMRRRRRRREEEKEEQEEERVAIVFASMG